MRSSLVVRASDCQCTSCNGPGFDPSIRRHSGIWGAADEAVLNIVRKKKNPPPPKKKKKLNFGLGPRRSISACTAKNQCRKLKPNIPRKWIARPQSQFPNSCVCERLLCSHDRSAYSAGGKMWTDPGNTYINRSQIHECGNWDWGRAIPRKGIHKWDFRYSV